MDKRTSEIIMICKGNHDYGENLNHKEAIAAYMSDVCLVPLDFYSKDYNINRVIYSAALDFIDNADRPSHFIKLIQEFLDVHNNPAFDNRRIDYYEAICIAFQIMEVMDDGEYVNGFTEENTGFVYKKNKKG